MSRWLPHRRTVFALLLVLFAAIGLSSLDARSFAYSSFEATRQSLIGASTTCDRQPHINDLVQSWGIDALEMGQAYVGSGARVRQFLGKLLTGQPVTLAILGGSITVGHSLSPGEQTWPLMLMDWLNATFPHNGHQLVNGAVAATGTDYFAACYSQHVPEDADMFIVETAVNDKFIDQLANVATAGQAVDAVDYTETLTREILSSDRTAALVMLSVWTFPQSFMNGADKHATVSEYYDIPRVSTRSFLYNYFQQYPGERSSHYNQEDWGHQSQQGHRYMADLLIYMLEKQLCQIEQGVDHKTGKYFDSTYDPLTIPPVTLRQRYSEDPKPERKPFCLSSNIRLPDGSWGLNPSFNKGFSKLEMWDKSWWTADEPGSLITFSDVEVHGGSVGIYYYRSGGLPLGNAECWVDNDRSRAQKLKGPWNYASVGSYAGIRTDVSQGKHSVSCEVLQETDSVDGSHHFRIIAIMAS